MSLPLHYIYYRVLLNLSVVQVTWRLCSYCIYFFAVYLLPDVPIVSVKSLGLLGVFLIKKASHVALSWAEGPLGSRVCSSIGRRLLSRDHGLTFIPLSKVLSQKLPFESLPEMEPNLHFVLLGFGSPLLHEYLRC